MDNGEWECGQKITGVVRCEGVSAQKVPSFCTSARLGLNPFVIPAILKNFDSFLK